ncbi:MAG TPA: UvrD-helicase domain-containing protein [Bryobacteraceae bacterium]|jgi:ATP-dependent exoDNAse (exonuclease V) beta subunit|nr:UvrD-helicase domain-containing protein [Bryobacteraceae bacterium]
MTIAPDQKEREQALDPTTSFIVEAPAGSGKTTLLVNRFLNLLKHVERPEAVVAVTFTRKAAAEMRERVLKQLPSAIDPARLQIQTIDSLCAMLTRQMPVASQLGGAPRVIEHADELYRRAARRTLQALSEGDPEAQALFQRVSLHFDNALDQVERQITKMLEKREQWRGFQHESQPPDVQVFCDLLGHAERELVKVFREAGEVDFTAITRAAIDALGTPDAPSDLLYWLDYRIEHLLVDEFQDTSRAQYDLFKALTEQWSAGDGRTLFLVGDPMQSIYRFREAELSLFLDCWDKGRLADVPLTQVRLRANFRSTPEIVSWTQKAFEQVMTEDDLTTGGVKLRPAVAAREESGPIPSLKALIEDNGAEEAAEVVRLIKESPARGETGILVRSRSHLQAILPALRAAGVAYEAVDIDELQEQQHILDILSITRALLHPGDRTAWLACLRAPWCGLTLADLATLAERDNRLVLSLLSDTEKVWTLSSDGRERAARTGDVLRKAVDMVGRVPVRELVEGTWLLLGGPAALANESQVADVNTCLDLIEEFEDGGVIQDFSLLNARLEFLYARGLPGPNSVKVMTIHSAKGLEFDTVILPQLSKPTSSLDSELLIWAEDKVAALPLRGTKDPDYEEVRNIIKAKEQHEMKRLFYVATTRARNRLHLLGSLKTKKGGTETYKASDSTFLGLIWPRVEHEFKAALAARSPKQQSLALAPAAVTELRRLPASWRMPKLENSVLWRPELQRATASARRVTYEWVSDTARHIGTLVHEVLKRIAKEGCAGWTGERVGDMAPLFRSELLRLGIGDDEPAATAKIVRAVTNTLASRRGQWLLGTQRDARSEWAISGRLGEKLISGSIDRAFRDEAGRFWIIDFKTSEHEGGNLKRFLDEEQRRYREQLETYAAIVQRVMPGVIALGLYFPLHDAWREWEFKEAVTVAS